MERCKAFDIMVGGGNIHRKSVDAEKYHEMRFDRYGMTVRHVFHDRSWIEIRRSSNPEDYGCKTEVRFSAPEGN